MTRCVFFVCSFAAAVWCGAPAIGHSKSVNDYERSWDFWKSR